MKKYYIEGLLIILFSILFVYINFNNERIMKEVVYNGNNLLISIDGFSSDSIPTTGTYYLTSYTCNDSNTKVTWNSSTYKLDVSNGKNGGSVSCSLEFKSNIRLSEVPIGSYIKYVGKGGMVGNTSVACQINGPSSSTTLVDGAEAPNSCLGQNVREDIAEYGYCWSDGYYVTGWRLAYVDSNDKPVIISAGSPECYTRTSSQGNVTQIQKSNALALKYCNPEYVDGNCTCTSSTSGQCSSPSTDAWAINDNDFNMITKAITGTTTGGYLFTEIAGATKCGNVRNLSEICGYNNDLIDIGDYYWFSAATGSDTTDIVVWQDQHVVGSSLDDSLPFPLGLRPVISLKSSVYVVGGTGTMDDPYDIAVIEEELKIENRIININSSTVAKLTMPNINGVSKMCISIDTSVCSNYISYQNNYSLDLSGESTGVKDLYVYYKNSAGKIVSIMRDFVVLETKPKKSIFDGSYVADGITSMSVLAGNGSLGKYNYVEGSYMQLTSGWTSGQSLGNISVKSNSIEVPDGYDELCYVVSFVRDPVTTNNNVCNISFGGVSQSFDMSTSMQTKSGCIDVSSVSGSQYFQADLDCGIYNDAGYSNAKLNIHHLYFK